MSTLASLALITVLISQVLRTCEPIESIFTYLDFLLILEFALWQQSVKSRDLSQSMYVDLKRLLFLIVNWLILMFVIKYFSTVFYNFSLSDAWANLGTVFILQLSVYKSSGSVLTISIRSSWQLKGLCHENDF